MSSISPNDLATELDRLDDEGSQAKEASMNHKGHSMKGHMLLCVIGMIAGIAGGAVLGINVAVLFCAAMMISMVWMMAAPAVSKLRNRNHANH